MQKLVLVTGSSRGIGRSIVIELSKSGWKPLIHYKENRDKAKEVSDQTGGYISDKGYDLSKLADCIDLWNWASSIGNVQGLVNNAGIYEPLDFLSDFEDYLENWDKSYRSNLLSTVVLTKLFIEQAIPGSKIVSVCSRVGFKGEAGASSYAASKAGQINLVRSLSVELAPLQIGVFGIAPGWAEPAMLRPGMENRRTEIESTIPMGRVASGQDCGKVVAFLMSEDANYLSGQVIDINGASYFH